MGRCRICRRRTRSLLQLLFFDGVFVDEWLCAICAIWVGRCYQEHRA